MTNAPHLLPKSREGFKYGDVDAGRLDGLRRALPTSSTKQAMGELDRAVQRRRRDLTREEQDAFAARVAPAGRRGLEERRLRRRGRPGRDPAAQGRPGRGQPRTRASAATPPPSRSASCARRSRKDGTITAGSASQISDGACAVVVMSKAKAEELGPDLARRDRRARHGRRPRLHAADAAGQRDREGLRARRASTAADLDLVEINEAFAAVGIASARELGIDRGQGQRQRRRHRARPPGRHVRRPDRAAPRARAASAAAAASARPRCAAAAARATR